MFAMKDANSQLEQGLLQGQLECISAQLYIQATANGKMGKLLNLT